MDTIGQLHYDAGIDEGIKIGNQQGEERGENRGMIRVYFNEMHLTPEEIAAKLNQPIEKVKEIIKELRGNSKRSNDGEMH